MMPLVLKFCIATAEEVEIETIAERLKAESLVYQGVVKPPEMVSAWAIKP
jgi:hypothetical protein